MTDKELDVRGLPKPDKPPMIVAACTALSAEKSLVLVNDHDPKRLREQLEGDHAGSYRWDYLENGPVVWRTRITKHAANPPPCPPTPPTVR